MHSHGLRNLNGRAARPTALDLLPKSALDCGSPAMKCGMGTETCFAELTILQSVSSGGRTGDPPATKETKPMEEET